MEKIIIKVKGMVCNGCENRIKNAIEQIEGVEQVTADYKKGIVTIELNSKVNKDIIYDKIENIGFEVLDD